MLARLGEQSDVVTKAFGNQAPPPAILPPPPVAPNLILSGLQLSYVRLAPNDYVKFNDDALTMKDVAVKVGNLKKSQKRLKT